MNWKKSIDGNLKRQDASGKINFEWFGSVLKMKKKNSLYFSLTLFNDEMIQRIRAYTTSNADSYVILICSYLLTEHKFFDGRYVRIINIPDLLF